MCLSVSRKKPSGVEPELRGQQRSRCWIGTSAADAGIGPMECPGLSAFYAGDEPITQLYLCIFLLGRTLVLFILDTLEVEAHE